MRGKGEGREKEKVKEKVRMLRGVKAEVVRECEREKVRRESE